LDAKTEQIKASNVPALAKNFTPYPHPEAKPANSSPASIGVKQPESVNNSPYTENGPSEASPSNEQNVSKVASSENGKSQKDVDPKPPTILKDVAGHSNVSTSMNASTISGKRPREEASNDTNTTKRQDTGQTKTSNDHSRGVGNPASTVENNTRPAKRPLEGTSSE
jgi:hypothetical protein